MQPIRALYEFTAFMFSPLQSLKEDEVLAKVLLYCNVRHKRSPKN